MADSYALNPTNKVRQLREKASYDRETVHRVLDAGIVAHVAFIQDHAPVVVPMIYGRIDDTIFLHGARKSRIIRLLEETSRACLNVTLLDGIVLARSAFNSSMEYRSVTVFGRPQLVDGSAAKLQAMRVISEHSMPGRWDELRDPLDREIKMTGVITLEIETASAKISDNGVAQFIPRPGIAFVELRERHCSSIIQPAIPSMPADCISAVANPRCPGERACVKMGIVMRGITDA